MTENPSDALSIRNEVTVYDILVPVGRYRKFIFSLIAIGTICAIAYQFLATPLYTAQITIAPLPSDLTLSQTGNSIAGLSLFSSVTGGTTAGPTDFDSFMTLLQSQAIAHNLERDYGVKKYIFSNSWDSDKKRWTSEKESFLIKMMRAFLNKPWHPPTDSDLADYLSKKLSVTTVAPFTVITYDFKDPKIAQAILGGAISETQKVIRNEQHHRAITALAFLDRQLGSAPSSLAQQALIALSIQWEQKRLLAETDLDVGVEISEPLSVSELPTSPSPLIDLAVGVLGSAFLGIALSIMLGLFVSDDPRFVGRWIGQRVGSVVDRIRGLRGRTAYRLGR